MCRTIGVIDADSIAREVYGPTPILITNTTILGAFCRVSDLARLESLLNELSKRFSGKNRELSLTSARMGWERASAHTVEHTTVLEAPVGPRSLTVQNLPLSPVLYPKMYPDMKTGDWRTSSPRVDNEKCKSCGICVPLCPEEAISLCDNLAKIDYDYCKGCGICAQVCPTHAVSIVADAEGVK